MQPQRAHRRPSHAPSDRGCGCRRDEANRGLRARPAWRTASHGCTCARQREEGDRRVLDAGDQVEQHLANRRMDPATEMHMEQRHCGRAQHARVLLKLPREFGTLHRVRVLGGHRHALRPRPQLKPRATTDARTTSKVDWCKRTRAPAARGRAAGAKARAAMWRARGAPAPCPRRRAR